MVYSISNSIGDHSATDSDHAAPPCALIPKLFPPSLGIDYTNVRFRPKADIYSIANGFIHCCDAAYIVASLQLP